MVFGPSLHLFLRGYALLCFGAAKFHALRRTVMGDHLTVPAASGLEFGEPSRLAGSVTTGTPAYLAETSTNNPAGLTIVEAGDCTRGAFCCAGTDLPGMGFAHTEGCDFQPSRVTEKPTRLNALGRPYVAGEVPRPLYVYLRIERPLCELLFAARNLAQARIEPEDSGEAAFCTECTNGARNSLGSIAHEPACKTGRVLRLLDELMKEPELDAVGPVAAPDGFFGEPWLVRPTGAGRAIELLNRDGEAVAISIAATHGRSVDIAFRIADCVNSAAGKGGAR
jgi:hypothetical protein